MSIYQKLGKIQKELNVPKTQYNQFGKYNYRSCEGILEALKPLLEQTNTVILLTDAVKEMGGRVYIEATATLLDTEDNGTVTVTAYAREEDTKKGMDSSQVTGAASSYARKYALNGLFAIDDNKDSDATNDGSGQQPAPQRPQKPAPQQPQPVRNQEALRQQQLARQVAQQQPQPAPKQPRQTPPPPDVQPGPEEAEDGYYYCKDCGQIISDVRLQNGQHLSPKEVAVMGMQNFGDQICYSCGAARMKARRAG